MHTPCFVPSTVSYVPRVGRCRGVVPRHLTRYRSLLSGPTLWPFYHATGEETAGGPGRSRGDSALRHPPPHPLPQAPALGSGLAAPAHTPVGALAPRPQKTQAQRPQDAAALPTPTIKAVGARPVPKATGALATGARPRGQPTAAGSGRRIRWDRGLGIISAVHGRSPVRDPLCFFIY